MKQKLIAVPNLGADNEILAIAQGVQNLFDKLDASTYIARLNTETDPNSHELDTDKLVGAPKIIIYTNILHIPNINVLSIFQSQGLLVDIVQEKEMYNSLFISYGDPDKDNVATINNYLEGKGVQTWFFPSDALPGQKLHRVMYDGVNKYDRVLLVCSKDSLKRSGVLNEIERVLEREAREGGSTILIPITLDDFVYSEWAPERADIANQVRSRVITKFPKSLDASQEFLTAADKLIDAIRKHQSGG